MSASLLDWLMELETAVSYSALPPEGELPFVYRTGDVPILISAPHATVHQRGQREKGEEEFTGALAQLLAETTGVHTLYSHYRSADDPNWDRVSPYKTALQEIVQSQNIRFVLDLHGMSNRHRFGLALGTMNGRSCPDFEPLILETVREQFQQTSQGTARNFAELRWDHFVLNHPRFTGGVANYTVTRFAAEQLGVPALQIELCSTARVVERRPFSQWQTPFRGQPEAIQQAVALLQSLVTALMSAF